ncbi:MAG: relaxase/mobilization nuclease domain-containing protein [Eubacteriales bacterium]
MAYVKIIPIKTRLDNCINYVLNDNKTGLKNALNYITDADKTTDKHVIYQSAINCRKHKAYKDMMDTKKVYGKTGGVLGYHIIHSYKPNEITPELAHKIGVEFAEKCFGDKYEVVVATHIDKQHIHNHITINSVSFVDGKKYRNNFKDYFEDIRGTSNEICSKYGLSVIMPQAEKATITYSEWLARNKGKVSWQSLIRMDIDDSIKQAFNYGNFLVLMQEKGYEIKQGMHLAFRPYGKERFSRTYKLGGGYYEESIRSRILGKDLKKEIVPYKKTYKELKKYYPKGKVKGFQALVLHYMYILGMVKRGEVPEEVVRVCKEDLIRFDEFTKTFEFLKSRNLDSFDDITQYKAQCEEKKQSLRNEKKEFQEEHKEKSELYAALVDYKMHQKAHLLFQDGYSSMEDESLKYFKAEKFLKDKGYTSSSNIEKLNGDYIKYLESLSKYYSKNNYYNRDSRICNNIIILQEYVKTQIQKVESKIVSKQIDKDEIFQI